MYLYQFNGSGGESFKGHSLYVDEMMKKKKGNSNKKFILDRLYR